MYIIASWTSESRIASDPLDVREMDSSLRIWKD